MSSVGTLGESLSLSLGTNSGTKVSAYGCKFKNDDIVLNSIKGPKDKESLFEIVQSPREDSVRFDEIVRNFDFNHSNYPPSTSSA